MKISQLADPLIIAHRGLKKHYPENTISAFDAAIENRAVMIELDVSLSKDREVVVIHDDTLDRTTNGTGLVCDYTLAELKELDAGSWFSKEFKNEKIPTLIEIFEKYVDKTTINIEIKPEAFEVDAQEDSIEKQIIKLLREFNCFNSTIISSFEKRIIHRISQMPDKPLLAFLSEEPADSNVLAFIKDNDIFSWNPDYTVITQEQISLMHENGVKVFSFTVNDKATANRLLKMGVDGLFTDDIVSLM